ncbi:MAG: OmpA family protein [candidate division Zixibacteria bacterium]|nr:OmpA family protein [candidate division Zixibacteria bacterium]
MRRFLWLITATLSIGFADASASADPYRYAFGGFGGPQFLSGGDVFSFEREIGYGVMLGHRVADRWQIGLALSWLELKNDTAGADTTVAFDGLSPATPVTFDATRVSLTAERLLFDPASVLNVKLGAGGGLLIWKMIDPETDRSLAVTGKKNQITDFAATELILTGLAGVEFRPLPQLRLGVTGTADYLTGGGADFSSDVNSGRDRLLLGAHVSFSLLFGSSLPKTEWRSDEVWPAQPAVSSGPASSGVPPESQRDSDADGVPDALDKCAMTVRGVEVDRFGCPLDGDRDGVPDGLDDCPDTPAEARGRVDIYGCPVDSDFDGIPDYLDACPGNPMGAAVDDRGCPVDSDADGVPDGLDDCPYTIAGVEVDRYGCIDMSMFAEPMVLNIDYPPGSFEIDPNNKKRVEKLANLLSFVTDIKLEINGYTDNIGTDQANEALSEKRARRVMEFLIANGVSPDRMRAYGRGEKNFVADNQTAEGRARNRRIEIVFYR